MEKSLGAQMLCARIEPQQPHRSSHEFGAPDFKLKYVQNIPQRKPPSVWSEPGRQGHLLLEPFRKISALRLQRQFTLWQTE